MRFAPNAMLVLAIFAGCSGKQPATATEPPVASSSTSVEPVDAGVAEVADAASTTEILFVHQTRVDCVGEGPRKCLQVRHVESEPWTLFYSGIQGFTYEEGHTYQLRVEVVNDPHPPADGSSKRYRLVEIVSKH